MHPYSDEMDVISMDPKPLYELPFQIFVNNLAEQLTISKEAGVDEEGFANLKEAIPSITDIQVISVTPGESSSTTPYEDISGNLISGLGIFILFLSVAIIIIVIAVVIKYKMRKSDSKIDTDNAIEVIELPDPYQQAIVFPNDPKPNWPVYIKKSFKDAGKKIMGKGDPPHRTTIPEHLKPQLKHIYVY